MRTSWITLAILWVAVSGKAEELLGHPDSGMVPGSDLVSTLEAPVTVYEKGLKPLPPFEKADFGQTLDLSGSRGEILNFMLLAQKPKSGCMSFNFSEWKGSKPGASVSDTQFYEVLPFVTEHASYRAARVGAYPDPLIPRTQICAADASSAQTWILGEFKIPEVMPPGIYETSLGSVKVKLKVWKMVIPKKPAIPLYSELTTYFLLLGHYGKWHEGEAALSKAYMRSMAAHRIAPYKNWVKPIQVEDGVANLREAGDTNAASTEDGFYSAVVSPLPDWAYLSIPLPVQATPGPKLEAYTRAIRQSLQQENWLKKSFVYLWDEPQPAEIAPMIRLAQAVRKTAPELRLLVTTDYRKDLENLVDIFVPIMNYFDYPGKPAPAIYQALQKRGKEFWLYTSCMSHGCTNDVDSGTPDWVIDRPGTHIRSQAWIASAYHANALLYYSVDNGYQHFKGGRDPWKNLWDFTGNGDGNLYYPGRPGLYGLKEQTPVESLRLKLWRESSYDAEYIHWMNALPQKLEWWSKLMKSLVRTPRDWEHSNQPYADARKRLGDYLDQNLSGYSQ